MNKLPAISLALAVGLTASCSRGPDTIAEVDCSKTETPSKLGQIAYFGLLGNYRASTEVLSVTDGQDRLTFRYDDGSLIGDLESPLDTPGAVLAELPTATVYAGMPRLSGDGYNMGAQSITLLCNNAQPSVVYGSSS